MQAKRRIALFDVDQTLTVARSTVTEEMIQTLAKMQEAGVDFGIVSGSDRPKIEEQLNATLVNGAHWCFAENGLQAWKKGEFVEKQSFENFLGKERLDTLCDFCQDYIDKLDIPVKTSVHVERRAGMINVSPIGRACSRDQRNEFEQYDHKHNIRKTFVALLKEKFADYGLRYSVGGQISFDVFPEGWDKSFCLKFVEKDYDEIHFWGDKCYEGGNDFEIYKDPRTIGHSVKNPEETIEQLKEIFNLSQAGAGKADDLNLEAFDQLKRQKSRQEQHAFKQAGNIVKGAPTDNQKFMANKHKEFIEETLEHLNEMHASDDSDDDEAEQAPTLKEMKSNNSWVPEPIKELSQKQIDSWLEQKKILVSQDMILDHSAAIQLGKKEAISSKKLDIVRERMMKKDDPMLVNSPHYETVKKIKDSDMYEAFKLLPKPAVHHCNLMRMVDPDFLVKLTYYRFVFYSEKEQLFKVTIDEETKKKLEANGYMKVNSLRQYQANAKVFDQQLREMFLLKSQHREDHLIWGDLNPKFDLSTELIYYEKFFEMCVFDACKKLISELVCVVEHRHIFGQVYNDNGRLNVDEEMAVWHKVQKTLQTMYPMFRIKIIASSLRSRGPEHFRQVVDYFDSCQQEYRDMIVGFDMTRAEEDEAEWNLDAMLPDLYEAKERFGDSFKLYCSAGESCQRTNSELYDAIILGTKRIGHGFALARHPTLIDMVKEADICVTCCPTSNQVMGYVGDLRCHPVRGLLQQGVAVSLNPGTSGMWDSRGVTYDYMMCYLAWDLSLRDLKQLVLNSLKYSSVDEEHKHTIMTEFFENKWTKFLEYIRGCF